MLYLIEPERPFPSQFFRHLNPRVMLYSHIAIELSQTDHRVEVEYIYQRSTLPHIRYSVSTALPHLASECNVIQASLP